jgi:hypothetical protein
MAESFRQIGVVALPLLCLLVSEFAGASMFIAAFVADFWNDHGGTDWYLCHPGLLGYCAALPNGAGKAGECCDPFLRARHTLIILPKKNV